MSICRACATENEAGSRTCRSCGAALDGDDERTVILAPPRAGKDAAREDDERTVIVSRPKQPRRLEPAPPTVPVPETIPPLAERIAASRSRGKAQEAEPPPAPAAAAPAPSGRRSRTLLYGAVGVAAVVLTALAFWRLLGPPPQEPPRDVAAPAPAPVVEAPPPPAPPVVPAEPPAPVSEVPPVEAAPAAPPAAEPATPSKVAKKAKRRAPPPAPVAAPEPPPPASVPVAAEPPPPAPAPAPSRWDTMAAEMAGCQGKNFLARNLCENQVRSKFCGGYAGKVPQCPAAKAPEYTN